MIDTSTINDIKYRQDLNNTNPEVTKMNEGLKKFRELFLTDEDFRNKVNVSLESYDGEESVEAVFNNVFAPIAAEYGISASFDEFEEYISGLNSEEVSEDELAQIA